MHNSSICAAFQHQAEKTPGKAAICFGDKVLTFGETDLLSDKIAGFLSLNGYSRQHIGICLPRSPEIIISILGILKADNTYVFIDPAYPPERIQYLLDHADLRFIITSDVLKEKLNSIPILTGNYSELLQNNYGPFQIGIHEQNAAYIMYTSATTGKPKGVIITHANVISYINAISELIKPGNEEIYLHTASFSFSSSVRQYLVPLLGGFPVYLAAESDLISLRKLLEKVKQYGITIMDNTPALWRSGISSIESLEADERKTLLENKLRLILFSGDMLPALLIHEIGRLMPGRLSFMNVCGQTEDLGAIAWKLPDNFRQQSGIVPIGYPLSNTTVLVLNDQMKPASSNETGELYVSSPSVGSGYYKSEELTAKTFISDFIPEANGKRFLRTGDMVKVSPGGPIEIAGRKDFQVKIRGVRINLSEVENTVTLYAGIQECIVALVADPSLNLTMVACITSPGKIRTDSLKHFLRNKLPSGYIPDSILQVDSLPRNINGKYDRQAISEMASRLYQRGRADNTVKFKNETEKNIYNLFNHVLGHADFGLTDSFFDAGGHSLKAVELAEKMEKLFNRSISVEMIYKFPDIESLSSLVNSINHNRNPANLIAIKPAGTLPPFVCIHGDDANFLLPKYLEDIPFYGFFHQGRHGERIRHTTIDAIAESYTEELIRMIPEGPYIIGGYSIGGVIAFAMIESIRRRGREVSKLILIDSLSPQYNGAVSHYAIPSDTFSLNEKVKQKLKTIRTKYYDPLFDYYLARFCTSVGLKVPLPSRNEYIMGVYRRARKKFNAGPIRIQTLLIRCTDSVFINRDLGWSKCIESDLIIKDVHANHANVIKEPQIAVVGEEINRFIREK